MLTFILAGVLAGTLGMTLVEKVMGDTPDGGGGGDEFDSEPSDLSDRLQLDDENNLLLAGSGNDLVNGGAGNDTLDGEAGRDALYGQEGDDELRGGAFHDLLSGGEGNDLLQGQTGRDLLYGGEGDDTLEGGAWHDTLFGGSGDDILIGGDGSDELYGIDLNREFTPDELHDHLDGKATPMLDNLVVPADTSGADLLEGGAGDDKLVLGRGDTAVGGGGEDQFGILVDIGGDGIVTITDYQGPSSSTDSGDVIQIEATDATALNPDDYDVAADLFSGDALILERGEVLARIVGAADSFTSAQLIIASAT